MFVLCSADMKITIKCLGKCILGTNEAALHLCVPPLAVWNTVLDGPRPRDYQRQKPALASNKWPAARPQYFRISSADPWERRLWASDDTAQTTDT